MSLQDTVVTLGLTKGTHEHNWGIQHWHIWHSLVVECSRLCQRQYRLKFRLNSFSKVSIQGIVLQKHFFFK